MLKSILGVSTPCQVGMITGDIDRAKKKWAEFLGVEEPEARWCGDYAVCKTEYMGQPAPEANSKLAFIDLTPGVQLELIDPNKEPSVWRDHLEKYGEGIHHIAFNVDNTDAVVKVLTEEYGAVVEQHGVYGDGSGQYTYLDVQKTLKCRIELLESFRK